MIFYSDIISLPEKHPGLKVEVDAWNLNSGGKILYIDLEFHLDDETRKACKWIYSRFFKTKEDDIDKSFRTITAASFMMMITPDGVYDNAILVNRVDPEDPDAYIRVNTEFADNFVCTRCAICRNRKEVDDAIYTVEGRLKKILQKYKKHLIEEAAHAYNA
jgi:hypothetical protein